MSKSILITGAYGMLGNYLRERFADEGYKLTTLGLNLNNDIVCDLGIEGEIPALVASDGFEGVVHAAATADEAKAMQVNYEGTRQLLKALESNPPKWMVYISHFKVYSNEAGTMISEEHPTWATDKIGQSKQLAEKEVREWCDAHGVLLTILRPAYMFGTGITGEMADLFNQVVSGEYIHIRDNNAVLSLVTAYDVARIAMELAHTGGTFNVSDGREHTLLALAESMSKNAGSHKRMSHLPLAWAETIYRFARFIPLVSRQLNPETLKRRSHSFTLDSSRLQEHCSAPLFDTLAVIARTDQSFPYME